MNDLYLHSLSVVGWFLLLLLLSFITSGLHSPVAFKEWTNTRGNEEEQRPLWWKRRLLQLSGDNRCLVNLPLVSGLDVICLLDFQTFSSNVLNMYKNIYIFKIFRYIRINFKLKEFVVDGCKGFFLSTFSREWTPVEDITAVKWSCHTWGSIQTQYQQDNAEEVCCTKCTMDIHSVMMTLKSNVCYDYDVLIHTTRRPRVSSCSTAGSFHLLINNGLYVSG